MSSVRSGKYLDTGLGYLRTPGKDNRHVSCNLFSYGNTDIEISKSNLCEEKLSLRPALWVKNSAFEAKIWSQVECNIGPLDIFMHENDLRSKIRNKLTSELLKKERQQNFGNNLQILLVGSTYKERESIARTIMTVYHKSGFIPNNENFAHINESNFCSFNGEGMCFFDTERALSTTFPPRNQQIVGMQIESKIEQTLSIKLLELMNKKNCAVVLGGSAESIDKFFELYPELKKKFNSENTVDLSNDSTTYGLMEKKILSSSNQTEIEKQITSKDVIRPKLVLKECLAPFGSLVGMENFKSFIQGLIVSERQRNIDIKYGIVRKKPTLHMIITGNPGTGKTTVAKMLGEILFNAGLIDRKEVISVERADLVDSVVGGSEALTKRKLAEAKGAILFIDEAYALTDGNSGSKDNDFGRRVIEGLLNPLTGDDCVIILAGYPDKMKQFVDFNPGLMRRFAPDHRILLPDYTSKQLFEIFNNLCLKCGLLLENGSEDLLIKHFETMKKVENFGNAGYVERLFEKVMKVRDFCWQETMGEDCDELMEEQVSERKLIKLQYTHAAIKEFEQSLM